MDPINIAPGINTMAQGLNVFNGDTFTERPTVMLYKWSFDKEHNHFGKDHYYVPDQILNVPDMELLIDIKSTTSELHNANSMESLQIS